MAKIMLVEDDNNLREIYEARLLAEGYEIVAAKDGEEALALAVKEKPDLIISDVMMPKISGFDMLDILRSTAETKDTKVIMMTALSQAEDKSRADKLGADRYLVKSQVTLEDVAKVAHDVLAGIDSTGAAPAQVTETPVPTATPAPAEPTFTAPDPVPAPEEPVAVSPTPEPTVAAPAEPIVSSTPDPVAEPATNPEPVSEPEAVAPVVEEPVVTSAPDPVPAPDPVAEPAPEVPAPVGVQDDLTQTTAEEEKAIESQINAIFSEPAAADAEETTVTPPPDMSGADTAGSATETAPVVEEPQPVVTEAPQPTTIQVTTETIVPTEPAVAPAPDPETPINDGSVPVVGKKVIQPINDMSKGPDINELLAKEGENAAVPSAPATSVVSPGGQTVIPVTTDAPATDTQPQQAGNVISPGDIAL